MPVRISKNDNIDVDSFDTEIILMNLVSRQVVVMNEAAGVLWSALDSIDQQDDLLDLLVESMPSVERGACSNSLSQLIGALTEGGFVTVSQDSRDLPDRG